MECPVCATTLVETKRAMACGREHGIFVLGSDIRRASSRRADREIARAPKREGKIACPRCSTRMDRKDVMLIVGLIEIDACPGCGGHWFDRDELVRIVQAAEHGPRGPWGILPPTGWRSWVLPDLFFWAWDS